MTRPGDILALPSAHCHHQNEQQAQLRLGPHRVSAPGQPRGSRFCESNARFFSWLDAQSLPGPRVLPPRSSVSLVAPFSLLPWDVRRLLPLPPSRDPRFQSRGVPRRLRERRRPPPSGNGFCFGCTCWRSRFSPCGLAGSPVPSLCRRDLQAFEPCTRGVGRNAGCCPPGHAE